MTPAELKEKRETLLPPKVVVGVSYDQGWPVFRFHELPSIVMLRPGELAVFLEELLNRMKDDYN